jgi:signal transduction histidine kinase
VNDSVLLAGLATVGLGVAALFRREQTRRNGAEADLAELRARCRALERRAADHEKLQSLGMLAASVAHEINNPMAYVTANVRALLEDLRQLAALPEPLLEYVEDVLPATLDGIERVNAIVSDLRAFSREDPGQVVEFDLNTEVEAAIRIARNHFRHRASLHVALGPLPPAVGRPRQLTQVVVNLLVNASQAVADRGNIHVVTLCDPDEFVVEVRDDGAGIPTDVRDRLFRPFFTTKQGGQGTGLGLAVANGFVRAHGGRITVESEPGQGATFRVHLPRVSPVQRRQRREAAGGSA